MVLTDCEIIEAECNFLLIHNGLVSNEICNEFYDSRVSQESGNVCTT